MIKNVIRLCWLVWLLMSLSTTCRAQVNEQEQPYWNMSLAVGYGQYGAVLHGEQDHAFYLLPRWQYYHGRFYAENLDLGWNLIERSHWSWDLTSKQSFDALLFRQHSLRDALFRGIAQESPPIGIPWDQAPEKVLHPSTRHFSYLAGTTLYWRLGQWQLSTAGHHDISSVHHGVEVNTELRYRIQHALFDVNITAAVRWLDSRYSNYYFGFNEADSTQIYVHQPGAQWLPSLKIEASWPLSERCRLLFSVKRELFSADINDSIYFAGRQHDIWFSGVLLRW